MERGVHPASGDWIDWAGRVTRVECQSGHTESVATLNWESEQTGTGETLLPGDS